MRFDGERDAVKAAVEPRPAPPAALCHFVPTTPSVIVSGDAQSRPKLPQVGAAAARLPLL